MKEMGRDIAVLQLLEVLPDDITPMSLMLPTGRPLVTKGFPAGYSAFNLSAELTIAVEAEANNGWVQLDNPKGLVTPGFSGAPVYEKEENLDKAVGMIVASAEAKQVAWMIPTNVLRSVLETPEILQHLVKRIELSDFKSQAAIDLIQILKGCGDFSLIWDISCGVLPPDIKIDRADMVQDFKQVNLSNFEKSFKLVKLFIEDYPDRTIKFVNQCMQDETIDSSIRDRFTDWQQKYFPIQTIAVSPTRSSVRSSAYLMVVVEPTQATRKKVSFRLSASLVCISAMGKGLPKPIDVDGDAIENGKKKTYELNKLPERIHLQIKAAFKLLNTMSPIPSLTIELFLPFQHLCEPIDQWEIKDAFGDLVKLGNEYRLVVRSYNRVIDPTLRSPLEQSHRRMKDRLDKSNDSSFISSEMHHVENIDSTGLNAFIELLRKKSAVKVTCPLPETDTQRLTVLKGILKSGIPIAFWTRCRECVREDASVGIDRFLTIDRLRYPPDLLEEVRTERAIAVDSCGTAERRWARHLTVLWDDFERMPGQLDEFSQGGSRQ